MYRQFIDIMDIISEHSCNEDVSVSYYKKFTTEGKNNKEIVTITNSRDHIRHYFERFPHFVRLTRVDICTDNFIDVRTFEDILAVGFKNGVLSVYYTDSDIHRVNIPV